jgi:hypothetical protein
MDISHVLNGIRHHNPNNIPAAHIIHDFTCAVLRLAKNNKCNNGPPAKVFTSGYHK